MFLVIRNNVKLILVFLDVLNREREGESGFFYGINKFASRCARIQGFGASCMHEKA